MFRLNNEMTQRRAKLAGLRDAGQSFPNDFRRVYLQRDPDAVSATRVPKSLVALTPSEDRRPYL
jgi:lysyl-tRNA synthetase class 2